MSLHDVSHLTEEQARDYLEKIRWPQGVACPHCGGTERNSKLQGKAHRAGVWKCGDCREQFTVTVGTIMHRSHIPLSKWVMAFHMMCSSKKGVSAHQLWRNLGFGSYRTAWHMAHRIRLAMREEPLASMLSGTIEADETYIGGKKRKPHRKLGRPSPKDKAPVLALVERKGRVRARAVANVTSQTLKQVVREHCDPSSSRLMTDEYASYRRVGREFVSHETVCHSAGEYARGDVHTNTVEGFFAILKRGVNGTFHSVSRQHLQRYLDEFSFRYNHRWVEDDARAEEAIRGGDGKRLVYRDSSLPGGQRGRTGGPWPKN
jgi:transposase-like protein